MGVFSLIVSIVPWQVASAACEKIRISYTTNWVPVAYDSEAGDPSGIAIEVEKEIFKRLNLPLEFVSGLPWRRQMEMLDEGEIDAIAAIHYNPERAERLLLTDAFSNSVVHVYINKYTDLRYTELKDLINYVGVLIKDASYGEKFDTYRKKKLQLLEAVELIRILELLKKGRVDYMLLPANMSDFIIQNYGGEGEIEKSGPPVLIQPIHMGFSRKSKCKILVDAVNEQIKSMTKDGILSRLEMAKYSR